MLKRSSKSEHLCIVFDLKEKSSYFTLKSDTPYIIIDRLYQVNKFSYYSYFSKNN